MRDDPGLGQPADFEPVALWEPSWLEGEEAQSWFEQIRSGVAWRQDRIQLFGSTHDLPRLQAWYGDPGTDYTYSGIDMQPLPWLPVLATVRDRLAQRLQGTGLDPGFNAVLCNLYRNGRDSNGWHSDDERRLGTAPIVASISLGATRRFRMRPKQGGGDPHSFELGAGSLLIMAPGAQANWQHTLTKTARPVGERINLTFRRVELGP